jgi:hypothetical protein
MSIHPCDEQSTRELLISGQHSANDLDYPTAERPNKSFLQLRAEFALLGHALYRSDSQDGAVIYWAEGSSLVRTLPSLEAVRYFLKSLHGRRRHG